MWPSYWSLKTPVARAMVTWRRQNEAVSWTSDSDFKYTQHRCCGRVVEYYMAIKRSEVHTFCNTDETWKHVKRKNNRPQTGIPFTWAGKAMNTGSGWLPVLKKWGSDCEQGVLYGIIQVFWSWMVVVVVQLCEWLEASGSIHSVDFIALSWISIKLLKVLFKLVLFFFF